MNRTSFAGARRPLSLALLLPLALLFPGPAASQDGRARAGAAGDAAAPAAPGRSSAAAIDIPYEKFVLDNGLTLIVHEDRKAPIVAVNVWYHVGSKNEKPGKTGFAHLFEHLMFNGTENYDDEFFKPFERAGATDMNGTTNPDRTNYFANVPVPALDMALWMESDRMGHLLGAVTQAKLDEQRGVVQNEKRQGENQPYGVARQLLSQNTYPDEHPYSWTTIGSMEDLDAASLEDVHEWFETYYGPNNAVIAIAGDIDPETAKTKVEKYFGAIPPGPPIATQERWIARREGSHRQTVQDRVPQARIYRVWNVPEWGSLQGTRLDLFADILGSGKNSRLYRRLVYEDRVATDVAAYTSLREIGGQFFIQVTARPGADLAEVEAAVEEELARLLEEGPTAEEVERVQTEYRARFVRGIERIGGFGGKSDVLAMNEVYGGSPDFYGTTLDRVAAATPQDLRSVAREWLSDGDYTLVVRPYPELKAVATEVDRASLPEVGATPEPDFPDFRTATLSNGLEVIVAERHAVPVVNFDLLVDAGYAADASGKPGTASLAMGMLDEGTESLSSLEIAERLSLLGAELDAGSNLDMSTVTLSALRENLDASLDIYADVVLNPSFPESEFERLRDEQLARIQREKSTPVRMALRVMPGLLYGGEHAYGIPLTGSGTEESVSALTRDDLTSFHRTWFRPNNATLVVVGAVSLEEVLPKLEARFGSWRGGEVPGKDIAPVEQANASEVFLIDRPGSQQSIIFAGHLAPPKANPHEIGIGTLNDLLGGSISSRINMNLREDKHWSYGAFTLLFDARGQRPFIVYAPVETGKTKESIQEVVSELRGIVGDRPVTADELAKTKANLTLTLPGRWETIGAVSDDLADIVRFDLPHEYWDEYAGAVRALELADMATVAEELVHPERIVWVVVGDLEEIEPGIRELDLGPVHRIDPDGRPVGAEPAATGPAGR